jgi:glutamate dehydrogenase (NAD(P)+)
MLEQMEELTGKKVSGTQKELMLHGPDEVDLVNSGLEETMIMATHEIIECWKANPTIEDMRTASFVVAINKVGMSYAQLGIFP